jgi:hypothetical protein
MMEASHCFTKETLMIWKTLLPPIVMLALLAGCATGPSRDNASTTPASGGSRADACNADLAEGAVGKKVSTDLVEQYRQQANAKTARALRPRDVMTLEYNPQRLNLRVDEQDIVTSVNCG